MKHGGWDDNRDDYYHHYHTGAGIYYSWNIYVSLTFPNPLPMGTVGRILAGGLWVQVMGAVSVLRQ